MHDLALAQINNSAVSLLHDLDRAASPAQATHLEHIEDVKQIRRAGFRGRFDRFQQPLSINRLWKNFCARDLEPLLGRRITREKQDLEPGKNFAERAAQRESVHAGAIELRKQEIAARVLSRPTLRGGAVLGQIAPVLSVVRHHPG